MHLTQIPTIPRADWRDPPSQKIDLEDGQSMTLNLWADKHGASPRAAMTAPCERVHMQQRAQWLLLIVGTTSDKHREVGYVVPPPMGKALDMEIRMTVLHNTGYV